MNEKMLPKDAELYRRVDEIVHYMWDPIGVCAIPQARGEYSGYLTGIFGRVQAGDLNDIVEFLRWASSENMGLSFEKEKATEAARAMLAWKEFINGNS
ncbi:hypothetical protein A167_01164 [Alcanivorax sp. S71-1-4]|uniref:hypothetical protein n=1 Tax=Alcanivorax sp. S71-1-4 TaxID=1177159 RepID=UPI00135CC739|nr:hypothetical protein [Alcanivorax sp. S71-1-4]KAF0810133.1 hypothetical protein A167_01164 [Alcanivorax sp. S71-1-4]